MFTPKPKPGGKMTRRPKAKKKPTRKPKATNRPKRKAKAAGKPKATKRPQRTPKRKPGAARKPRPIRAKKTATPIAILHGYLLDGSGSNLWTQAVVRSLCRAGHFVHLICQEPHPELFDFVARAVRYDAEATPTVLFERDIPFLGACTLHRPDLGGILPVYVEDRYEEHQRVIPMIKLDDGVIEDYIARNAAVLDRVIEEYQVAALHANHVVLMPVVARRVARDRDIPFTIMPHGSAIEYAVKRDARFHRMASQALRRAGRVFVIGPEIRARLRKVFPRVAGLDEKLIELPLGVDARRFAPIEPGMRYESIGKLAESLQEPVASSAHEGPDPDCAAKLMNIDWRAGKFILYVGRLIAAKGPQAIVAAMPSILQQEPEAHLILAGHGPLRRPLELLVEALQTGDRQRLHDVLEQRDGGVAGDDDPLLHARRYIEGLEARGELARYLRAARRHAIDRRIVFTGYLSHRHLRHLFPSCDVAVFPSLVPEAGPLVFLEAVAAGVFPLGTYFAGMAANIDALARTVPSTVADVMKLRREPEHLASDIASHVVGALRLGRTHADRLRQSVMRRHDWSIVGRTLVKTLDSLRPGFTFARTRVSG